MLSTSEASEVFELLEGGSGGGGVAELQALYCSVREPWLVRALLLYHARTGAARALDFLARAPEPHAKHLLDALHEELLGGRPRALAALAPLLARRPPWLHRLPAHPLCRELCRAARTERDPAARLHALLALAVLLPAAPAAAPPLLPELAAALPAPSPADPHLALAAHALFHALYATHPAALLDALRAEHAARDPPARERLERALRPLLESARLHPALVLPRRRARLEPHDVLAECRRYSLEGRSPGPDEPQARTPPPPSQPAAPAPPRAAAAARSAALRPGLEPWFPLSERCGADSAPHTPLPAAEGASGGVGGGAGGSPPEAAVEATPENTPAKEPRAAAFTFPAEGSAAVRALSRLSQPPSPLRKESSPLGGAGVGAGGAPDASVGRLARVMMERARAEAASPVPMGGAPPPAAARPEPRAPEPELEPLNVEDREVLELTTAAGAGAGAGAGAALEEAWPEDGAPALHVPRARRPLRRQPPRPAPSPRRAASCPPVTCCGRRRDVSVQTVDVTPPEYEFVLADLYRTLADDPTKQEEHEEEGAHPSARLDAYLARLYRGEGGPGAAGAGAGAGAGADLAEQLALTHAQLMYERWRREAHAERNRRLLGRCRQARALELNNAALRERVRAQARDLDELRAREAARAAARPPPDAAAADREHALRVDAALSAERVARERAEAQLRDAEAARVLDQQELQRLRSETFEAARRGEQLARASRLAESRGDQVRRLRQELLLLGEREARLNEAAQAAQARQPPASGAAASRASRALREEAAAARAEAEAATARAEAAAARAHELEAQLAAREAAAGELRRAARLQAEEHAARLEALQDKYRALMHVLRRMEARRLETLAGAGAGGAAGAGAAAGAGSASPHSSPLSASLASGEGVLASRPALADCSRVRHLLEDEEPPAAPAAPLTALAGPAARR